VDLIRQQSSTSIPVGCATKLQLRWREALRNRHSGADSKPPQAAVDESPMVVSVEEKAHKMCQVRIKKVSGEQTNVSVETCLDGVKIGDSHGSQDQCRGYLIYCLHGIRRKVGTSLIQALLQNVGTLHMMIRENPIRVAHEGGKYRCML